MTRAPRERLDEFLAEFEWTRPRHNGSVLAAAAIFEAKPATIARRLNRARQRGIAVAFTDDTKQAAK